MVGSQGLINGVLKFDSLVTMWSNCSDQFEFEHRIIAITARPTCYSFFNISIVFLVAQPIMIQ